MAQQTTEKSQENMTAPNRDEYCNPDRNPTTSEVPELARITRQKKLRSALMGARANNLRAKETADARELAPDNEERIKGVEVQHRRVHYHLLTVYLLFGYLLYLQFSPASVVVNEQRLQSQQVLLVDDSGVVRMQVRMYSDRPILQLLDSNGTARLSLGMRFDDSPFIDFADRDGKTRASFHMTGSDEPAIRLYGEDGKASFALN